MTVETRRQKQPTHELNCRTSDTAAPSLCEAEKVTGPGDERREVRIPFGTESIHTVTPMSISLRASQNTVKWPRESRCERKDRLTGVACKAKF